ncbi:MAG: hypothetical protein LBU39_05065 [Desulfobulbaceae bacterium]|jgi:hypothetical protein|nr:hypothetical protein [Desulfobulbaceae bacterium]
MDNQRRWYDQDPVLSMAMCTLEQAGDEEQIMLALHLIKIINEHNMEDVSISSTDAGMREERMSRWYDVDKTLSISIEMLRRCPEPMQRILANQIVRELKRSLEGEPDEHGR